jgi:hypothetical protein
MNINSYNYDTNGCINIVQTKIKCLLFNSVGTYELGEYKVYLRGKQNKKQVKASIINR